MGNLIDPSPSANLAGYDEGKPSELNGGLSSTHSIPEVYGMSVNQFPAAPHYFRFFLVVSIPCAS
jgi:hypothetical protein